MPGAVVVGLQYGDEGKGKVVDYCAQKADIVVRFNGGANAGHTVIVKNETHKFHLMPSGVLWGKRVMLGAGMVIDPKLLLDSTGAEGRHKAEAPRGLQGARRYSLAQAAGRRFRGAQGQAENRHHGQGHRACIR